MKKFFSDCPSFDYDPNIYNKDRVELIKDAYRYLPRSNYHSKIKNKEYLANDFHLDTMFGIWANPHQYPGTAHMGMFVKYIELMGTEEHKAKYLAKCMTY